MVFDTKKTQKNAAAKGTTPAETALPGFIRTGDSCVLISVRAKPGSKRAAVTGLSDDAVELAIDAPARGGTRFSALSTP